MWTATIANKDYRGGVLIANVVYSSDKPGINNVTQSIDMTGGTMDVLSQKVQAQLDTLEATDALHDQIIEGPFTPNAPVDTGVVALNELRRVKDLVTLGVLKDTDPQVVDALSAAKSEVAADVSSDTLQK